MVQRTENSAPDAQADHSKLQGELEANQQSHDELRLKKQKRAADFQQQDVKVKLHRMRLADAFKQVMQHLGSATLVACGRSSIRMSERT